MVRGAMTRRTFLGATGLGAVGLSSLALLGCSVPEVEDDGITRIEMVTSTGGVNDQSFNQLSWAGMQELAADNGWEVSYIESQQANDYYTNLDKAADQSPNMIWAISYAMEDDANEIADQNPDIMFGLIEGLNVYGADNLIGTTFRSQESSFVVGYIAARMSESGKVGFVGGAVSETIQQFEYGYTGGVAYANSLHNLNAQVNSQYAESFTDSGKGKSIAKKMIKKGCDVLFHAAGGTGTGMIEACAESGVWAIGVDTDQSYLAPDTVITSALKRVDKVIYDLSNQAMSGEAVGGDNIDLGASENAVGISESHDLIPDDIYSDALEVLEKIKSGEIVPPDSKDTLKSFTAAL